jgi:hypothetical protein
MDTDKGTIKNDMDLSKIASIEALSYRFIPLLVFVGGSI